MKLIFPEIFETGIITSSDKKKVCADAICAWANCMAGCEPPKMFGKGMVEVGKLLGIPPTVENLEKYAIEQGWL